MNHFRAGVTDLRDVWRPILDAADLERLRQLAGATQRSFTLDDDLWVRVIYDLARRTIIA